MLKIPDRFQAEMWKARFKILQDNVGNIFMTEEKEDFCFVLFHFINKIGKLSWQK